MSTDANLKARIDAARTSAVEGADLADRAHDLVEAATQEDLAIRPLALTSIALSLSAIATVLLATIDDEARP